MGKSREQGKGLAGGSHEGGSLLEPAKHHGTGRGNLRPSLQSAARLRAFCEEWGGPDSVRMRIFTLLLAARWRMA